jgi:hypothetical protein
MPSGFCGTASTQVTARSTRPKDTRRSVQWFAFVCASPFARSCSARSKTKRGALRMQSKRSARESRGRHFVSTGSTSGSAARSIGSTWGRGACASSTTSAARAPCAPRWRRSVSRPCRCRSMPPSRGGSSKCRRPDRTCRCSFVISRSRDRRATRKIASRCSPRGPREDRRSSAAFVRSSPKCARGSSLHFRRASLRARIAV